MKILLVHSYYQIRGGEDNIVDQETNLLTNGNEVKLLRFYNKQGMPGAIMFFLSIWNIFAARKIKKAIEEFKPDVFHIHNWHFATGPLIIRTAKSANIPVIFSVHNFRLLCPSVYLMHNGKLFMHSLKEDFSWTAVKNKVYRNSFLQTFWLSAIIWIHKKAKTWKTIDRYIVNTNFTRDIFLNSSLNLKSFQVVVKPNFIQPIKLALSKRKDHFLFVGRLSEEKGIKILLEVFGKLPVKLRIAGEGPLLDEVLQATKKYSNITHLGLLDKQEILRQMQECSALVFPSIWYEGMPMTIVEAFSCKTMVIASNIGAMHSMIQHTKTGLLFEVNNCMDLVDKIIYWQKLPREEKEKCFGNIHSEFNRLYTPEINLNLLISIYKECLN